MSLKIHSILVVDDNPINQILIKQQLQYLGYKVELVKNGEEALQALSVDKFDILMTDLNMPGMDGYQLTQKIRTASDSRISVLPIIAITANATEAEEQKCLAAGMDGFLTKPIELNFLRNFLLDMQKADNGESKNQGIRLETAGIDDGIFDVNVVSHFVGGNMQMVLTLLDTFLDQTSEMITQIHAACVQNDMNSVVNECHKLKSSARSVGANRLADLCITMERAGNEGWLEDIRRLDRQIDALFNQTQAAIVNVELK